MGNCCGGQSQQSSSLKKQGSARVTAWHNTGIIGVRDGNLKELPDTVFAVGAGARTLDATNNKLTTVSPQLAQLSNLSRLVLTSNQIQDLPAAVLQLQSLKVLLLDSNMLTELPAGIGQLSRLERLSAAHNSLAALPASLGQLQKLQVLQLSSNKLTELPAQLGMCSQLEDMDVSDNYLQCLPAELGSLQRLKAINATSNRLQTVPPAILQDCSSLQTLLLHANPISAEALQAVDGYEQVEQRRRSKYDKKIYSGAHVGAMDTGVDAK
eukprot:jgi/Astpho2/3915/e_gw1.00063.151.1_t